MTKRESKPGRDVAFCIDANYHKGTNTTLKSRRQLVMEEHTIAYSKSHRKNHIDARGKIDGEANTISTGDGGTSQSTGNYVFTKVEMTDIKFAGGDKIVIEDEPEIRIRKLTPVECCRLQGYPDNHLDKGINDKGEIVDISNTQKYKMAGNGISAPVPQALFPAVFRDEHIKVMSLFSGCGGTELLLPDNFKVVGHCELDKYASSVLRYHYPDIPNFNDVTNFADRNDVPEFDMLVFGHPCQAFSAAGLRKGLEDKRGQLIYDVFRIIDKFKPKYIVGENVKGLLSHDKGNTFEQIMIALSDLGYELDFELVNSKHFGLAQNRQRVFYFGKLK